MTSSIDTSPQYAVAGKESKCNDFTPSPRTSESRFKVGDKVHVTLEVDVLKSLLTEHGGWNPRMSRLIDKPGTVHRITDRGDIRVQYDERNRRGKRETWTFHPAALKLISDRSGSDVLSTSYPIDDSSFDSTESNPPTQNATEICRRISEISIDDANDLADSGSSHLPTSSASGTSRIDKEIDRLTSSGNLSSLRKNPSQHLASCVDPSRGGKCDLHIAATNDDIPLLRRLLDGGWSVEDCDAKGETPLFCAVRKGHLSGVRTLLHYGANVNTRDKQGRTPLHLAASQELDEGVKLLLDHGADINCQNVLGNSPLHCSVATSNDAATKIIFQHPAADFSVCNKIGCNVLHLAATNGQNKLVEIILTKQHHLINKVTTDDAQSSPLHLAIQGDHIDVARCLITQGCDVNLLNAKKLSPLHLACLQQHIGMIGLIVENGADLKSRDGDGRSCVQIALQQHSSSSRRYTSFPSSNHNDQIKKIINNNNLSSPPGHCELSLYISCYLALRGAPVDDVTVYAWKCCLLECHVFHMSHRIAGDSPSISVIRSEEEFAKLQLENDQLREEQLCGICMEKKKDVALGCGHTLCRECASRLICCHICRTKLEENGLRTIFT